MRRSIGDAAGLVDPVSGDGMFEAFLSGKLAAEAVHRPARGRAHGLEPYGTRLTERLRNHLWASWSVKAALDRFPRTTFRIARSRIVWRVVERLIEGDIQDVSAAQGLARPAAQGPRRPRAGRGEPRRGLQAGLSPTMRPCRTTS